MRIEAPFDHRDQLAEGAHWDEEDGSLLYVDIEHGGVHRLDPVSGERRSLHLDGPVGFAVPGPYGSLVVGRRQTVEAIDHAGATVATLARLAANPAETRINDGKCDARGRLFYGTTSTPQASGGSLYRTVVGVGTERVARGVTFSNGLGWDEERGRLYYVDTWTQRIDVFDYDMATGAPSRRRPFVRIDPADGMPDGITVDAEGGVWVCLFDGSAVRRYSPEGDLSHVVTLPVSGPTSIAFGGTGLRTAFVTTAWFRLDEARKATQPFAGAVLVFEPGIAGVLAGRIGPDLTFER